MVILIISTLAIFTLMIVGERQLVNVTPTIPAWFGSGALIGLGLIVPGMSPSNFLIYFGLYDKMAAGINNLDMTVVIPLTAGVIVCILLFARLAAFLFRKYYSGMYHFILGMVLGSSLAIFPVIVFPAFKAEELSASGLSFGGAVVFCLVMLAAGSLASWLFSKVEEKYPREDLF
jgi:putative membrane protein